MFARLRHILLRFVWCWPVLQAHHTNGESIHPAVTPPPAVIAESTLIFPMKKAHVHASSIVELPDGT